MERLWTRRRTVINVESFIKIGSFLFAIWSGSLRSPKRTK
jgi:hypothetical protein